MKSPKTLLALLLALALVAAACGGDDDDDAVATGAVQEETAAEAPGEEEPAEEAPAEESMEEESTEDPVEGEVADEPADAFPVTIAAGNGEVTIEDRPERIVSISTVATETLFAIGAGDQVIAVDSLSNFPPEAPVTELSGFTPSVEAIAEFEPDLVILSFDPGDVIAGLDALGVPTILHGTASSLDDAYAQIEQTGAATGHVAEAAAVVADMQIRIDAAVASVEPFETPPSIFHEVSFDLFSSTSTTFIGQLYALFGVENIAGPRRRGGLRLPAAVGRVHPRSRPRHDLPRRRALRGERRDRGCPTGLGRAHRGDDWSDHRARHRHRQSLGPTHPRSGRGDGGGAECLRRRPRLITP